VSLGAGSEIPVGVPGNLHSLVSVRNVQSEQRIVVSMPALAKLDAGLGKTLGVADRDS
jgi:hypothetical protein